MASYNNGGADATSVTANGTAMVNMYANGVLIWSAGSTQTDTPTCIWIRDNKSSITMAFQNNDASDAEIFADIDVTPPTTSRGIVASGNDTGSITFSGLQGGTWYWFYCSAQASGETMSEIDSLYEDTD